MNRRLSASEEELQAFHSATREGRALDAHSLGVLPDPADEDMAALIALDKERLIARHHAHLQRLHIGIRQRAVEHEAKVLVLEARVNRAESDMETARRRVDYLVLALLGAVLVTAYFVVRDLSCSAVPWRF